MSKMHAMTGYQRVVLLVTALMALIFTVTYAVLWPQQGLNYHGNFLKARAADGSTVYEGKMQGEPLRITVTPDHTVLFRHGARNLGPYTMKKDPSAIPKDHEMREAMTGIEIDRADEVMFRGGVLDMGDHRVLIDENGQWDDSGILVVTSDGRMVVQDEDGKVIPNDPVAPTPTTIMDLLSEPALVRRVYPVAWVGGMLLLVLNTLSLFFADNLFRWRMQFRIRDAYEAEPSGWEIAGRYITWTALPILALVIFIVGLQS